jgi:hypothetical protein
MRRASFAAVAMVALLVAESSSYAKVAPATLADLVQWSGFIGIVRVTRVSGRIPFVKMRRATATILESWKGQKQGTVSFVAQATWICDISEARQGEEAIVFIEGDRLVLAGRGRMPIFDRGGRRLAAVWSDVYLPCALATEEGPEPQYSFIRGVAVDGLMAAVAASSSRSAEVKWAF